MAMTWTSDVTRPVDACYLLVRARETAGLTQGELAQRLGVGQSYVSALETGQRPLRIDMLLRVARATGAHLEMTLLVEPPPRVVRAAPASRPRGAR